MIHTPLRPLAGKPDTARLRLTTLAAALALAMGTGVSQAAPDTPTTLGAITVEAQSFAAPSVGVGNFRDQGVLDTPLVSSVISREVLDAQGARTTHDALRNTAGVTRHQISGSAYDNLAIRGILVENRGNYRLNGALPVINLVETRVKIVIDNLSRYQ